MNSKDLEDVDDDLFISKKPQSYIFEEKKDSTSQSLARTKQLLNESEHVGRNALEDLAVQRESLERTETNLDQINAMNRLTQKHLKNMRSFFGGFKGLFSDNSKDNDQLKDIVSGGKCNNNNNSFPRSATVASFPHPNTPMGEGTSSRPGASNNHLSAKNTVHSIDQTLSSASSHKAALSTSNEEPDDLDEIGFGLGRLKELAMKLGNEIEDHNDMLDRITDKTDRAGDSIKHQNRHMQQLLKK